MGPGKNVFRLHLDNGKLLEQARGSHILRLEQGERLLEIPDSTESTYHRARVVNDKSEHPIHNWQVRLLPNAFPEEAPFKGLIFPTYMAHLSAQAGSKPMLILLFSGNRLFFFGSNHAGG